MEDKFYAIADVSYGKGGIVVNTTETSMYHKHYNVKITKVDDLYFVTAERPEYDCFLENQFDPEIVDKVIDDHVELTSPFLGFGGGKRYVHGWCELKNRKRLNIFSNNITIVNK